MALGLGNLCMGAELQGSAQYWKVISYIVSVSCVTNSVLISFYGLSILDLLCPPYWLHAKRERNFLLQRCLLVLNPKWDVWVGSQGGCLQLIIAPKLCFSSPTRLYQACSICKRQNHGCWKPVSVLFSIRWPGKVINLLVVPGIVWVEGWEFQFPHTALEVKAGI